MNNMFLDQSNQIISQAKHMYTTNISHDFKIPVMSRDFTCGEKNQ